MARIALRAYNREIERLIEGGQIEEAIAHCRHIFKYFPKHINTYRLLGKAYLETQRYGDAADILQRVLSSIPDDFISHLGMSIIREDEGNLDEAIWHMERAFEVQPANRAIQDELRRLYGRRDGLEPPKIRLTRGALSRMYAKGDLYPQAIAEMRAALAEEPQRLDMQVVLADVYAKSGQRVEAASICNGLLRKLPYCLIANQVMADILADTERSEDARVYRQRAQALDPYLAHISPGATTPDKVPDIAVSLERLDWQPGKSIEGAGQPDWAASLGVEIDSSATQTEEIPDWLSAVQAESEAAALPAGDEGGSQFSETAEAGSDWILEAEEAGEWPETQTSDTAQMSTAEEIPDWMKAAGWSPATGEAEEEPPEFDFDEEDLATAQSAGELEEANLPDWLKEIAPENLDQAGPGSPEADEWEKSSAEDAAILQDTPDWFKETESDEAEEGETADWLVGLGAAAAAAAVGAAADEQEEEIPDWLKGMEAEEGVPEEEQVPDWLQDAEPESEQSMVLEETISEEALQADEIPNWLQEAEVITAAESSDEIGSTEEIPDWLKEMEAEEAVSTEHETDVEAELAEELPDWLQEMTTEEIGAGKSEEVPEWLKEAEIEEGVQPEVEEELQPEAETEELAAIVETLDRLEPEDELETAQIEVEEEAIPGEEPQPWMIEDEVEIPGEMMGELPAEPAEELPDWLVEMQSEEETGAAEEEIAETTAESPEKPGSIVEAGVLAAAGMAIISALDSTEEEEAPKEQEPQASEEMPTAEQTESAQLEEMDADAAFAWLEGLAAKQGADEQGMLLSPEERSETPPEWVQASIGTETGDEESKTEAAVVEPVEEEAVEEAQTLPEAEIGETIPDWLVEAEEGPSKSAETVEPLPDWLQESGETLVSTPEEAALPAEELPDWLKDMQEGEAKAAQLEEVEEFPDWLTEATVESESEQEEVETVQDWLTELEEPFIEGDTKPTRLTIEPQESERETPEETPAMVISADEAETEFQTAEESREFPPEGEAVQAETEDTEIDADLGFAWLESLAAKQGAEEGMLLTPEERQEEPPEWIQSALDKQFGEAEVLEPAEEATAAEEEALSDLEPTAPEVEADETPELPVWLSDIEAEITADEATQTVEVTAESDAARAGEEEIPELPSWLAEIEEQEVPAWSPPEPVAQKLDLNKASLAELERLPGIGFIMAQKIVTFRELNGPLNKAEDLQQIPGFSAAMLDDIEDLVRVEHVEEEPLSLPIEADTSPVLAEARQAMVSGALDLALEKYSELILHKQALDEVIYDLNRIIQRHGDEAAVWQTLGDAQMRGNYVQEALESYMRAEQLFR